MSGLIFFAVLGSYIELVFAGSISGFAGLEEDLALDFSDAAGIALTALIFNFAAYPGE
ncbi:MAG: hypothetical protein WCP06_04050 [Verrucomicrobiota bacterium]